MKLIAHVATRFIGFGAERAILDIVAACPPPAFDHVMIIGREHDKEAIRSLCGDLKIIVLENLVRNPSMVRDVLALRDLVRTLAGIHPDIVHTSQSKAGILARTASRIAGVKTIVHSSMIANVGHDIFPLMSPLYLILERMVAGWTSQYLVNGLELRERNLRAGIGKPDRYEVIRSAVDLRQFRDAIADRKAARRALDLPIEVPVVLFAGRLEHRKGALQLPRYFEALRNETPNAVLVIAGNGPLQARLKTEFASRGLANSVHFLGFTTRLPEAMAAADCLVMLSRAEGMATVLVHAAASGTPFVSYSVDGPRELIEMGAKGAVTPIGEWREAAALTSRILTTPPHPPLGLEEWSTEEVRARYRRVFDRLAESSTSSW